MLSEMCKREHCHCLCLQENHRAPHLSMPKITEMTLIAERPHFKYGSTIPIRSDLKVKGVSVWEQDNGELILIEMTGVVLYSVYKPPNKKFVLSALGHGNYPSRSAVLDGRETTTPTSSLYLKALLTCVDNQSWSLSLLLLYAFRDLWTEWGDSNFQIFLQNCQSNHRRLELLGHFNVLLYISF